MTIPLPSADELARVMSLSLFQDRPGQNPCLAREQARADILRAAKAVHAYLTAEPHVPIIDTTDGLKPYPVGTVMTDNMGDVWMIDRPSYPASILILMSPETQSSTASDVLREWGPLKVQWIPS